MGIQNKDIRTNRNCLHYPKDLKIDYYTKKHLLDIKSFVFEVPEVPEVGR